MYDFSEKSRGRSARGLSYQGFKAFEARPQSAFRPGLKALEGLLNGLVQEGRK